MELSSEEKNILYTLGRYNNDECVKGNFMLMRYILNNVRNEELNERLSNMSPYFLDYGEVFFTCLEENIKRDNDVVQRAGCYYYLGRFLDLMQHSGEEALNKILIKSKEFFGKNLSLEDMVKESYTKARGLYESSIEKRDSCMTRGFATSSSFMLWKHTRDISDIKKALEHGLKSEKYGSKDINHQTYIAVSLMEVGKLERDIDKLKQALERFNLIYKDKQKRASLKAEDFSYRARCNLYLGRRSQNSDYLDGAIEDMGKSIERGQQEPQNYSLLADMHLCRAKIRVKSIEQDNSSIFNDLLAVKENLEKAIEVAKDSYAFHYFLLGESAYFAERIEKQGFLVPQFEVKEKYWWKGIEIYIGKADLKRVSSKIHWAEGEEGLLENIFLLKEGEEKALEEEKNIGDQFLGLLKENKKNLESSYNVKYMVPKSLGIYKKDNKCYYAMRLVKGKTLLEKLQDEEYIKKSLKRDLKSILHYLAFIHGKMPVVDFDRKEFVENNERYLRGCIDALLEQSFNSRQVDIFLNNIGPIMEIKRKDSYFVFYKDAHPGNWVVAPEESESRYICAIDFEKRGQGNSRGVATSTYDLVTLLDAISKNTLHNKERFSLLETYCYDFNDYSGRYIEGDTIDLYGLKIFYLNSSIYKAISLASKFQDFDKKWRNITLNHLTNAENSADLLKGYYPEYVQQYGKIKEALCNLALFLYELNGECKNAVA